MIDTASDHNEEQIDTTKRHLPHLIKRETDNPSSDMRPGKVEHESLEQVLLKAEESFSSSDEEWEEVESKIIAFDCSNVHVLTQAFQYPQSLSTKAVDKKAASL